MVVVPAGDFKMGSLDNEAGRDSDEGPQHAVTIAQPFAVGRFEVTFAEWDACVAAGACKHKPETDWGRGNQPVMRVSWNDVSTEYLPWLSKNTGKTYRLLTEAEWEYSARAKTTGPFSFDGKITTDKANHDGNYSYDGSPKGEYRAKTVPVKTFDPNPWGLYQVHGNVWEWVQDCKTDYKETPRDGSVAQSTEGCARVLRGGSWSSSPQDLRAAYRDDIAPGNRGNGLGFRVARTLTP